MQPFGIWSSMEFGHNLRACKKLFSWLRCSERLARARVAAEAGDGELTFAPAINDRSLRLALVKEIRELRDRLPACARLAAGPAASGAAKAVQGAAAALAAR